MSEHVAAGIGGPARITDAPQRALIERARTVVAGDDRILAAWLAGSYATGQADAYSDVDLHCMITEDSATWFAEHWPETAAGIAGPLVLASGLPGLIGGYALTADWLHLVRRHELGRCPFDVRLGRGVARDGEAMPGVWVTEWMPADDGYFAGKRAADSAECVVEGSKELRCPRVGGRSDGVDESTPGGTRARFWETRGHGDIRAATASFR
jgi:hypothetical protein